MESYIIRINGIEYDVEIERKGETTAPQAEIPASKEENIATKPPHNRYEASEGANVVAGTSGSVWKIIAPLGATVKKGDPVIILEAMKMEIPIVASVDGKITKMIVSEGEAVSIEQIVAVIG